MQDDDFSCLKTRFAVSNRSCMIVPTPANPRLTVRAEAKLRQNAIVRTNATIIDGLSDQFVIDVGPEDQLSWARACRKARCASSLGQIALKVALTCTV